MNDNEYINFPVSLLQGFLADHKAALIKIIHHNCDPSGTDNKKGHAGITKATVRDFLTNPKTATDVAVLCAFLAIKSIVGQRAYARITKDLLLCRMAGHDKPGAPLPKEVEQWGNRKRWDHIKKELKERYNVAIYTGRGLYFSTRLSLGDLAKCVKANQENTKKARTAQKEKMEIDQALKDLQNGTP